MIIFFKNDLYKSKWFINFIDYVIRQYFLDLKIEIENSNTKKMKRNSKQKTSM